MLELWQDPQLRPFVDQAVQAMNVEAGPALAEALVSKNEVVRENAFFVLKGLGPKGSPAIPALIELLKSTDGNLRIRAGVLLKDLGAEAVPALLKALKDKNNQPAFEVLSQMVGLLKPAVPELMNLLKGSSEPRVRLCAVRLLGMIGRDARPALSTLRAVLEDSDADVRQAAEKAIKQLEDSR
jgi:HEAT repeat protein